LSSGPVIDRIVVIYVHAPCPEKEAAVF